MEAWGIVFLGIIAVSSVVQAAVLVGLARAGQRLGQRMDELQKRIDRDIRPGLESLRRVTDNLAEMSDIAALQTRRLGEALSDGLERVEAALDAVQRFVLRPLGPLTTVLSLLRGLRRGVDVYRRLGAMDPDRRGRARRYESDEHLFI
jgi:hypothetical protein